MYVRRKEVRNQKIIQYRLDHPNSTLEAIGNVFHLTKSRVSVILAGVNTKDDDRKCHCNDCSALQCTFKKKEHV